MMQMTRFFPLLGLVTLTLSCSAPPGPTAPNPKPVLVATTAAAPTQAPAVAPPAASSAAPAPAPAAPPSKYAACEAPPVGMACIPGGPAVIGTEDAGPREKPRHTVEVSTFYIDRFEVTNRQYAECEKAAKCPVRITPEPSFNMPEQPAVPLTWNAAHAYCVFAGKRMPTEAEWEKVARGGEEGRLYPWGSEPATCARAQTVGCPPETTKPVGSFPAGPYGVHDMAGNGYEWVNDWSTDCFGGCGAPCGASCTGLDPQGPCAGGPFCNDRKTRVLKGGSWFWPAEQARGSWRRGEAMSSKMHRLSVRCASTPATLATWPPLVITDPPKREADPAAPSTDELARLRKVTEDTDVLKIPACGREGEAQHGCRDPHSYMISNEPNQHVWQPYIENIGGGYVGIGADQSYSIIGAARSRWAWIFDYDPAVVRLHYMLRAAILSAETPQAFVESFSAARFKETSDLLVKSFDDAVFPGSQPLEKSERKVTESTFKMARPALYEEYVKALKPHASGSTFGWLRNPDYYRYVRLLYQQGRIVVLKGNLLTDVAMPSISKSARSLGVPVRIFYSSNADDQWVLTPQYRSNVLGLPFDEKSVILRTIYPRNKPGLKVAPWDYTVHAAFDAQRRFAHAGWDWVYWFGYDGRRGDPDNLVTVALPGRTQREKAPPAAEPSR
jgi:formylglycine-generating enzyme required for sulfatase activity